MIHIQSTLNKLILDVAGDAISKAIGDLTKAKPFKFVHNIEMLQQFRVKNS